LSESDIAAQLATFSAECIAIAKNNEAKNTGCNMNPYYLTGIGNE